MRHFFRSPLYMNVDFSCIEQVKHGKLWMNHEIPWIMYLHSWILQGKFMEFYVLQRTHSPKRMIRYTIRFYRTENTHWHHVNDPYYSNLVSITTTASSMLKTDVEKHSSFSRGNDTKSIGEQHLSYHSLSVSDLGYFGRFSSKSQFWK